MSSLRWFLSGWAQRFISVNYVYLQLQDCGAPSDTGLVDLDHWVVVTAGDCGNGDKNNNGTDDTDDDDNCEPEMLGAF